NQRNRVRTVVLLTHREPETRSGPWSYSPTGNQKDRVRPVVLLIHREPERPGQDRGLTHPQGTRETGSGPWSYSTTGNQRDRVRTVVLLTHREPERPGQDRGLTHPQGTRETGSGPWSYSPTGNQRHRVRTVVLLTHRKPERPDQDRGLTHPQGTRETGSGPWSYSPTGNQSPVSRRCTGYIAATHHHSDLSTMNTCVIVCVCVHCVNVCVCVCALCVCVCTLCVAPPLPSRTPPRSTMAATKSGYEGKIAGLYDLDRTLGKGHFAVVKLARHVFTGQLVAVKVIDKTKLDALATGHLLQEVRCMKLVRHPNVVRLYEVIDTHTKLYLILELADGGDMYDYILRHEGGVAEDTAKLHFAQIVRAIAYCHRLHIVHRDLKPENVVFFRQQGTVKLTDFGFSNHFQPGTMLMTSCGSLAYSAPEILLAEEYDAPAVVVLHASSRLVWLMLLSRPSYENSCHQQSRGSVKCREGRGMLVPDQTDGRDELRSSVIRTRKCQRRCQSTALTNADVTALEQHRERERGRKEECGNGIKGKERRTGDSRNRKFSEVKNRAIVSTFQSSAGTMAFPSPVPSNIFARDLCSSISPQSGRVASTPPEYSQNIWSLGVILYMLVCGHPPFQEATDSETLTMIMDCRYTVPDHVSAQCQDLIARMLQRDPSKRACLSEIEGHPWLQDTDPSPAAHTTAPLTSHRCLSAEEHELIVQAMTGGNIADRDTIQEALEADRYNHITATYYLLGERTLRNKSDQSGLVHEQRHTQRPLSAPLDLVDGRSPQAYPLRGVSLAPLAPLGSPSPGFVRRGVCESGDLLAPKPSQQDSSFADFGSPSTCLGLSFRSVSTDQPPTVKSLGALQQICEEEEEEEEEEEDEPINANLAPSAPPSESTRGRRSASESCSTSEQMDATRREIPGKRLCPILAEEEVFQQEGAEHGKKQEFQHSAAHPITEEQQGPTKEEKTKPPTEEAKHPEEPGGPRREEILSVSGGQRQRTPGLGEMGGAPLAPRLRAGRCCQAQREPSADVLEANNNTTPSKPRLLDADVITLPGGSPRPLPKNHCVDARPDTVETRRAGGESVEKVEEAQAKPPQAKRGSRDGSADPATARVDPGKSKNVNLRDRLLHFPICEKALSFNIQPASKEKLLPFAQYNCCHVL
ncbi:hypothetical protein P4O66_020610, partial [Electrophorus voltai]